MTATLARDRVEAALARADAAAARHVFTLRLDQAARDCADAADRVRGALPASPFLGVPVTIKDNFDLAGHATTAGSKLLADAPAAAADAAVVERLRRAGLIILGRTNMTEFAFSGLGLNPHYGTPANPAFPGEQRIPGGSSSGAAVSVALDIAPFAVGTDTGGSIRIPAALCGLVGFKPTAAAISTRGVLPLSPTLDAVGVLARTVADCAALFDVIRDLPGPVRIAPPPARIRLGLVTNYVTGQLSPEVEAGLSGAVERLRAGGVAVEPVAIAELDRIPEMLSEGSFAGAEAHAWHGPLLAAGRQPDYDPKVLTRIEAGGAMAAPAYVRLMQRRQDFIAALGQRMAGLDGLLWPTVPFTAPTIDSLGEDAAYHAANMLALRNSTVVNLMDGCAISIPCPVQGAPVGLTLAAPAHRDDALLGVASVLQSLL